MDIRKEIADKRADRIKTEGYGLSIEIPKERSVPLVKFYNEPYIICEVKRGSPSKGKFAGGLKAAEQAGHYYNSGVKQVSVLTEEDRFFGSLQDLLDIKTEYPELSVLRKDFLLDIKDVEVSYLCGADAILLIASLLEEDVLVSMYNKAKELGMTALVELHDKEDADKVRDLKPELTGINSRNLKNFTIDPLRPLKIRSYIDWDTKVIYESGIKTPTDAEFARDCGFAGVLVGELAVRDKSLAKNLVRVFNEDRKKSPWERLFYRYKEDGPFIKICGLTNKEDFDLSVNLGADLTGFILAESPRKVTTDFIKSLGINNSIIKVGVVVLKDGEELDSRILDLVQKGYLDFIQFHGDESKEKCDSYNIPYFKAHRIKDISSLESLGSYGPADLIDSFSGDAYGGTGKVIDKTLTGKAAEKGNLWLAGGLNPENIKEIVKEFKPELVDVSSGVESEPGKKDHDKLRNYIMAGRFYSKNCSLK